MDPEEQAYTQEQMMNDLDNQLAQQAPEPTEKTVLDEGEKAHAAMLQKKADFDSALDKLEVPVETVETGADGQKSVKKTYEKFRNHLAKVGPTGQALAFAADVSMQTIQDFGNTSLDLANWFEEKLAKEGIGDGTLIGDNTRVDIIDPPKSAGEAILRGVGQFVGAMVPVGAALKAAKLGGYALKGSQYATSAAISGMTQDPDGKNMMDWLNDTTYFKPIVVDALRSKPGDSRVQRRMKAFAIDLGLGVGGDIAIAGVAGVLKGYRAVKESAKAMDDVAEAMTKAKDPEDAMKRLSKVAETVDPEPPKYNTEKIQKAIQKRTQFEINRNIYSKIDFEESVRKEILDAPDPDPQYIDMINEYKRGTRTVVQDIEDGIKLVDTPEKAEAFLLERLQPGAAPLRSEEVMAAGYLRKQARLELNEFKNSVKGPMTPDQKIEFDILLTKNRVLSTRYTGAESEIGRSLRNAREIDVDDRYVDEYLKLSENADETLMYLKAADFEDVALGLNKKDLKQLRESSAQMFEKYNGTRRVKDLAYASFTNGAMAKVNSFMVNLMGNAQMFSDVVSSYAAAAMPWTKMTLDQANAQSYGMWQSLGKAFGVSREVFDSMKMPDGFANQFDINSAQFQVKPEEEWALKRIMAAAEMYGRPDRNKIASMRAGISKAKTAVKAANTIGYGAEVPMRAMTATDSFFKVAFMQGKSHQYAKIQVDALRESLERQGQKVNQELLDKMTNKLAMNPPEHILMASTNYANWSTFAIKNKDLGGFGKLAEGIGKVTDPINIGVGRILVPFLQTAANLADRALTFSGPLALLSKRMREDLLAGGHRAAIAQGRIAVGSGIMAFGAMAEETGFLKVGSEKDFYAERALEGEKSLKPDSFVINGNGVSIKNAAPLANVFILGGVLNNLRRRALDDEDENLINRSLQDVLLAIGDKLTPEYLMGSFRDMINDVYNAEAGKTTAEKIASGVAQTMETMTPYRWVYKNYGDVVKDSKYDLSALPDAGFWETLHTELINRYKFESGMDISDELPKARNIFGEEITPPPGLAWGMVSAVFSHNEADPVIDGLRKLGLDAPYIGEAPEGVKDFRMRMPERTIRKRVDGVEVDYRMTPKEYERYLMYMNEGNALKNNIKEILDSSLSEEYKKLEIVSLFKDAKSFARQRIEEESENFQLNLEKKVMKRSERLLEGMR